MLPTIMGWILNAFLLVSNPSMPVLSEKKFYLIFCILSFNTAEAFVGKGFFKKRISYHAKGKCGLKVRPECRLTVVVREMTPEEEAQIARLRVHNFRKLTKRERQLVPHKLIETTPIWNRKGKSRSQEPSGMAAWSRYAPCSYFLIKGLVKWWKAPPHLAFT